MAPKWPLMQAQDCSSPYNWKNFKGRHPIGYRLQATATMTNRPLFLNLIGPGCHHPPKKFLSLRPRYQTGMPEQSIRGVSGLRGGLVCAPILCPFCASSCPDFLSGYRLQATATTADRPLFLNLERARVPSPSQKA